jgi:hypothetical protein
MFAQLRNVLLAKDSTPMAQKNHNRRTAGPQRSKLDRMPVRIGQSDGRKLAAEGRHEFIV